MHFINMHFINCIKLLCQYLNRSLSLNKWSDSSMVWSATSRQNSGDTAHEAQGINQLFPFNFIKNLPKLVAEAWFIILGPEWDVSVSLSSNQRTTDFSATQAAAAYTHTKEHPLYYSLHKSSGLWTSRPETPDLLSGTGFFSTCTLFKYTHRPVKRRISLLLSYRKACIFNSSL